MPSIPVPPMTAADLDALLGRAIPDRTLAEYLGMDVRTLRKYHERWGGVEVSPGRFVFFEKHIKGIIENAKPEPVEPPRKTLKSESKPRQNGSPSRRQGGSSGSTEHLEDPYGLLNPSCAYRRRR